MINLSELSEECEKYPYTVAEYLSRQYKKMSQEDKNILLSFFN
jgi:hypothetical protein